MCVLLGRMVGEDGWKGWLGVGWRWSREADRAATLLIYLSDVPDGAGGRTVFPGLSVSVRPQKGRVLLWRNLDAQGRCMTISAHSAAPIADH